MKCCLFLMASFVLSGNVFADAAKEYKKMIAAGEEWQKENEEKYQGNMQDKMDGQSKMYNKYESQRKSYEEEMKSLRESNTKLALEIQELTKSVVSAEEESRKAEEDFLRYARENSNKGIEKKGVVFGLGQSDQNAEHKKRESRWFSELNKFNNLKEKLAEAKKDLEKQVSLIADSNSRLADSANIARAYQAGYHYDKSLKEGSKAGEEGRMAAAVYAAAVNGTYKLYTDMQKDHYEAQLLLTDFATLEAKHQITGVKLDLLKQRNYQFLQNTLIGDFVKQSIKAERESKEFCEAVNKCEGQGDTAQKITDLERRVNDVTGLVDGEADKSKKKKSDSDKK